MYFYIFVQTECVLMDKTGVCVGVCSGYRKIFAQRALPPRLIIGFRERNFTLIMFFVIEIGQHIFFKTIILYSPGNRVGKK